MDYDSLEYKLREIAALLDGVDLNTKELTKQTCIKAKDVTGTPTLVQGAVGGLLRGGFGPFALTAVGGAKLAGANAGTIESVVYGGGTALLFAFITLPLGATLAVPGAVVGTAYAASRQVQTALLTSGQLRERMCAIYAKVLECYRQLMPEVAPATASAAQACPPPGFEGSPADYETAVYDELNSRLDAVIGSYSTTLPAFDLQAVLPNARALHPRLLQLLQKLARWGGFKGFTTARVLGAYRVLCGEAEPEEMKRFAALGTVYYVAKHHWPHLDSDEYERLLAELFD